MLQFYYNEIKNQLRGGNYMSKKLLIGLITALFIVIAVVFIYFKFFTISENKTSQQLHSPELAQVSLAKAQPRRNQVRILVA